MGNTLNNSLSLEGQHLDGYGILKDQTLYYINALNQPIAMQLTYLGFLQKGLKHGKGIMANDTVSLTGVWDNGFLKGYATFITRQLRYQGTMVTYMHSISPTSNVELLSMEGFGTIYAEDYCCTGFFKDNCVIMSCSCKMTAKKITELSFGMNEKIIENNFQKAKFTKSYMMAKVSNENIDVKMLKKDHEVGVLELNNAYTPLDSCLCNNPLANVFKEAKVGSEEGNIQLKKLNDFISNLVSFQNILTISEEKESLCLKALIKKSKGNYHFQAYSYTAQINEFPCHVKAKLVFGSNDIQLASWNKMLLRTIRNEFQNFSPNCGFAKEHIGKTNAPGAYTHIIYVLLNELKDDNIDIFLEKIPQEVNITRVYPTHPMLYIEINEWLDPNFFLDQLCQCKEFSLLSLTKLFYQLIFLFSKLESRGIYHGNIKPQHIWYNKAVQAVKLIDFSNAAIANNTIIDKHVALHKNMDFTSLKLGTKEEVKAAFKYVPSYNFDYDDKVDTHDNIYMSYEEKYHNYNTKTNIFSKFSLFRKDAYAFAFTFFQCVVNILRLNNHRDLLNGLEKQWNRLSLIDELPSTLNNSKMLRCKLLVFISKFYTNVMKLRDNEDVANDVAGFDNLMRLCIGFACNIELGVETSNTLTSFYKMDKQNTQIKIAKFVEKIDNIKNKPLSSFSEAEAHIITLNEMNILFS